MGDGSGGSKDLFILNILIWNFQHEYFERGLARYKVSQKSYTDITCHVFKHLAIDCCLVSPSSAADPEIFPRGDGGSRDKGGGGGFWKSLFMLQICITIIIKNIYI